MRADRARGSVRALMNRTTKLAFWSASMLLSLGSLYACSSSSSDAGTGGGGDDKDATTSDGSSTSSGDSGRRW